MEKLIAIYLVFYKGYSVVRLSEEERKYQGAEYGACNVPMGYDYGHNGKWGTGDTPFEAVIDCYKNVKLTKQK